MQSAIKVVDVTSLKAHRYVRRSLRAGLAMGRLVDEAYQSDIGAIEAIVSMDATVEDIETFESGGVLRGSSPRLVHGRLITPTPNASSALAGLIMAFLAENAHSAVVVEDLEGFLLTSAGDSVRQAVRQIGGETYAVLDGAVADVGRITDALRGAYSLPYFNTVWASFPDAAWTQAADETVLRVAAEHAYRVAVGAYDAESYLIWTPTRSKDQ